MKKKLLVVLLLVLGVFTLTGCDKKVKREEGLAFKREYEALNGQTTASGKEWRSLNISEYNPMIKVSDTDIANKIENKETFYLYVGDPLCPWCRSGLQKFVDIAVDRKIKDIYYIDFWDDEHNEILRDLFEIKPTSDSYEIKQNRQGNEAYYKILKAVEDFAQDYTITKDDVEYNIGEKRIYGGDIFYFENGKCKKYVSLRSDKLEGSFDELTNEVLEDQTNKFNEFFNK